MASLRTGLGAGRPRVPDALKERRGTARKSRKVKGAPELEAVPLPRPPRSMTDSEAEVWEELAPLVDSMRSSSAADVPAFGLLVRSVARARAMDDGAPIFEWKAAMALAASWMVHFGLTPAARAKVRVLSDQKPKADPLDEFRPRSVQ